MKPNNSSDNALRSENCQHQPWSHHIPKHYSLDYDFSDDWDLVIAGTTAATGIYIFKFGISSLFYFIILKISHNTVLLVRPKQELKTIFFYSAEGY